jgi:hypothetical protein
MKRGTFEFTPKPEKYDDPDGSMAVVSWEAGVAFAVTEDKAVDSYNSEFTCEAVLPRAEAERLRDWLIEMLS